MAPTIEAPEASNTRGIDSRRLAMPLRSSPGPAASAPASATMRPVPRTKSM